MGETVKLHAADGHALDAYVAKPVTEPKGTVIVVQEIFGVNSSIRSVADRFAVAGYNAVAPALFDRYEPGFDVGYDEQSMQRAFAIFPKLNMDWAEADTLAAVQYAHSEFKGKVAVVGFCLGGSVAYLAAAHMPIDAAVGYYGGFIAKNKEQKPKAPTMLHFGGKDEHIPATDVKAIGEAQPDVLIYTYEDADHAFANDQRPSYEPNSERVAWTRTLEFLGQHVG